MHSRIPLPEILAQTSCYIAALVGVLTAPVPDTPPYLLSSFPWLFRPTASGFAVIFFAGEEGKGRRRKEGGGGGKRGRGRGGGGRNHFLTSADARSGAGTGEGSRSLREKKGGRSLPLLSLMPLLVF